MQSQLSKRLGSLEVISRTEYGVVCKTSFGTFRVKVFSESVFQITASQSESFEDFSYAVIAEPGKTAVSIEDGTQLIIRTEKVQLVIEKNPVSFIFKNKEGKVLNEDDGGLGISWIGDQVTSYRKLQEGERFIGLGEKTGPLDRKGAGYQNWTTDAYAYHSGSDPLYCSTPFYIGLHHQRQYGIFLDNTHKTFFNFGASNDRFSSFSADAGEMNYYFIYGDSVPEIVSHYTWLTGRMPMPPKWSIGYQQCRYSYYPDKEVLNVANTFREKEIPADAVVMDIHYMDKYKIFTWDQKNFSNPKKLIDELKSKGFEIVLMCDPGIKSEAGYAPYEDGLRQDVFVKYPDGQNYSGQVWPGWCHFPDFTNPKTRAWWAEKLKAYSDLGVNGYWNDMNEPATWGHMLPENLEFDFDGKKVTSRKARNVFGFQMARSTFEATKKLLNGTRPFNLTRSGFSGVQRYATVWTGDNVSYDEHMMLGVRLINSLGLTGIAFSGYDVGGFVGEASTRLFARWISIGALSPFFRGHTMINTKDAEPWAFGEEVEQISRNYIRLRYQLLPYLYSLFHEAASTGMPVQRSLALMHAHESLIYNGLYQHQYLFGPNILVAPVESSKEYVKIFFPEGEWYSLFDGRKIKGRQEIIVESPIHKLPVYVRAGGILPMQRPVQNTKEKVDELVLHIYHGQSGSVFELYEDDGTTYAFESGDFAKRRIQFSPADRTISISKQDGNYATNWKNIKLMLHGFDGITGISTGPSSFGISTVNHSFFLPLEKFDPINEPDSMGEESIQTATIPFSADQIDILY